MRDYTLTNNSEQIKRLITVIEEFALSQNPHTRKGGLIGLAAVAIGSGTKVSVFNFVFMFVFYFRFIMFLKLIICINTLSK